MDWLLIISFLSSSVFGVLTQGLAGQANEVLEPSFALLGKKISVVAKENVVLPCQVSNLGNYMVVWKRGIAVLSAGSVKVTPDERMQLVNGYDLQIRHVDAHDAGEYVCQLGTLTPREITHTLEILVPPRIHHSSEMMQVKRGASVTLECRASGNPVPTITWSRKNNLLPSGEQTVEGYSITIEQVTRHQAGTYQCTASNGVGEPVTQSIVLHVLYAPEIEVERSWVHSGEGFEAQLVCIVHAEPPADVLWYRDTLRLDTTERRSMEVRGSRHTLIIRKVQASDFGNYSCVADNPHGKMRQYLQLSGKPNQVVFRSEPSGRLRDNYNITWAVNSYTPIEEFKLFFRRLSDNGPSGLPPYHGKRPMKRFPSPFQDNDTLGQLGAGDWSDVVLPAIPSELFTQQMSYVIRSLEPGAQYEARVQARNRFGWNQLSEKFQFSTRGTDKSLADNLDDPDSPAFSDLDIRDLSMTASMNNVGARTSLSAVCVISAGTAAVMHRIIAAFV